MKHNIMHILVSSPSIFANDLSSFLTTFVLANPQNLPSCDVTSAEWIMVKWKGVKNGTSDSGTTTYDDRCVGLIWEPDQFCSEADWGWAFDVLAVFLGASDQLYTHSLSFYPEIVLDRVGNGIWQADRFNPNLSGVNLSKLSFLLWIREPW